MQPLWKTLWRVLEKLKIGDLGWRTGLAPAFGPCRDPGDPGSNPTSDSQCMEPASPSACVSASFSVTIIKKNFKTKRLKIELHYDSKIAQLGIYPKDTEVV